MLPLKFLTWNIRGIGSQAKRMKIINHLDKLQADICLLQETHLTVSDQNKLKSPQFTHVFSSIYISKQRGVSILINNKISFVHNSTITDTEGCFIIINISVNKTPSQLTISTAQTLISHHFFITFSHVSPTIPTVQSS